MLTKARVGIILLGMALLLGASTGAVMGMGVLNPDVKEGASSMTNEEAEAIKRQIKDNASYGYASKDGRTGRITSLDVEAKTFDVDSPAGGFGVSYTDSTIVQKQQDAETENLSLSALADGMLVTITRTDAGENERGTVTVIEIVPEGEGGFSISDASGDGPHLLPVLP